MNNAILNHTKSNVELHHIQTDISETDCTLI